MAGGLSQADRDWAQAQIAEYTRRFPNYQAYARVLKDVLNAARKSLAPLAIVEARPKAIASFGEKIWRKREGNEDLVDEFTDLCGGRVITQTPEDVEAVSDWIEDHFEIDWDNTVDKRQRLRPTEFGYRSVHYIVTFEPGRFPTDEVPIEVDKVELDGGRTLFDIPNPRAEVQVRTFLEHAWATMSHELVYKSAAPVPAKLKRDLHAVAAVLESADAAFARVATDLRAYAAGYDAYMSPADMRTEIERLRLVLEHDPGNAELAGRIGKLANLLAEWDVTEAELGELVDSGQQAVLLALGQAKCAKHRARPRSAEYEEGRRLLERAAELPDRDVETLIGCGDFSGPSERGGWYRKAFELDPSDPRALARHLEYEVGELRHASLVRTLGPVVDGAIRRCRNQAAVGLNLPHAFYEIGRFSLLREAPYASLAGYAKAIQLTEDPLTIRAALDSLERLDVPGVELPGFEWARRLLLVALASWSFGPGRGVPAVEDAVDEVRRLATPAAAEPGGSPGELQGPVVILAGGCSSKVEAEMQGYREHLLEAFKYFEGTILSGGTTQGIARLAGDVRAEYGDRIRTIGYIPRTIPADAVVDQDRGRYDEIRITEGELFSPFQPIQNWIDLVAGGVYPAEVKLLGINGGAVAGTEYRMALAVGAAVALIERSGRAAAQIFDDEDWASARLLLALPREPRMLQAFVESERAAPKLHPETRELVARAIHEQYRTDQAGKKPADDPAMAEWDELDAGLKDSNCEQADHHFTKLERLGYAVVDAGSTASAIHEFPAEHVELMAEWEHRRWNLERLVARWKWAEQRDIKRKRTPFLAAWEELADDIKGYDRDTVAAIPGYLEAVGKEIVAPAPAPGSQEPAPADVAPRA